MIASSQYFSQIAANNKIVGPVGGDEYDFNFSSLFCASLGFLDFDARLDKKNQLLMTSLCMFDK